MANQLTLRHFLLALLVIVIWGSNFVVIKYALFTLPPILFAALRFLAAAIPCVVIFRRPPVPLSNLAGYGMLIGIGQFALLYLAIRSEIAPGLASLVVQLQVLFTMGLAMASTGDRPRPYQWVACAIAFAGMLSIAMHIEGGTTLLGLGMTVAAGFFWACGNMLSRKAVVYAQQQNKPLNMLAYTVWSSLMTVPPLFLLSWIFEGWPSMSQAITQMTWPTALAVLWQSWGNTIFGYSIWAWLLGRYAAATISPLALLIPIFGMTSAALFLNEPMPTWKLASAAVVLLGLTINVTWPMLRKTWSKHTA